LLVSDVSEESESAGKQVIARAAAVLRALEGRSGPATQAQIACDTGLPRTTVQRLVQALEQQQMVVAGEGGVRLGPALTRLAASAHVDVISLARPHMEAVSRHTRETVQLTMERGEHAIMVDQVASDQVLRVVHRVGAALPLYCSAAGKALLSQLSDAEIERRLGTELTAYTPNTPTTLAEVLAQVREVRVNRVAENRGEHFEGVSGFGAVVRTGVGDRYALGLVAPTVRFERSRETLRSTLLRCVGAIEASLGVI
jgi:IclR family transcriptional regulator, acetate operon repressor